MYNSIIEEVEPKVDHDAQGEFIPRVIVTNVPT